MSEKIIRLKEVTRITTLSRSKIYALIAAGQFPKQVVLGERAVGWVESEVMNWITERAQLRFQGK